MARGLVQVQGLAETRRALRDLGRATGREFDREGRRIAVKVRDVASSNTPKLTGTAARSWKVSSTYRGIAVRSTLEYIGQIERGSQVWLRRGLPYAAGLSGPRSAAGRRGALAMRQVPAPPGPNGQARVVNEARYLRPRLRPLNQAATTLAPQIGRDVDRMVDRLIAKHGLG
ncbi:hypothetical protein [Patulibacter defluvii]|uniref:hypothetical protein n=1 Tax=Patulibacter defluvii TaxID=3095358 RepID=UPI002A75F437|nr:hypothetical protein [Patulibacter sp. DM4]